MGTARVTIPVHFQTSLVQTSASESLQMAKVPRWQLPTSALFTHYLRSKDEDFQIASAQVIKVLQKRSYDCREYVVVFLVSSNYEVHWVEHERNLAVEKRGKVKDDGDGDERGGSEKYSGGGGGEVVREERKVRRL
ncbi:hypothetical protein QYF36_012179 [Acer negundo]|nr:hypothetical protein QYF36_012179 [Acer negundo]